jgi:hypothetical protein
VCALATTDPPGDVPVSWLSPSALLDPSRR